MNTHRIEALADAIFAIAMTLLVIDLRLPTFLQPTDGQLLPALHQLVPGFLSYAISFVILGIFWIGHHNQMHYIRKSDRTFLWLNILFFMFIALTPFSASLLGAAAFTKVGNIFYAMNLILSGVCLWLIWYYGTANELTETKLDKKLIDTVSVRILTAPAFYAAAILSVLIFPSPFGAHVSHLLFLVPILIYVLPGRVDRHLR